MNTFLWILLLVVAFGGGMFAGGYILRKQVEKEFSENPRLDVNAVREMMSQMGQKPSEAKVQQAYRNIIKHSKAAANKKKK
ncbi:YneF family protein [Streptococcus sp. S784/96/1]|uniref:YneF family protein n=1 Tax=Streptococcus sp. S784/96/1 TaxID=2653499 RepID=UPI001386B54A|nr:YneF family protein [Streptococcus sp. S784/96/1]